MISIIIQLWYILWTLQSSEESCHIIMIKESVRGLAYSSNFYFVQIFIRQSETFGPTFSTKITFLHK